MTAAAFVATTIVAVAFIIAAIAAWEAWCDSRRPEREPEPGEPFDDTRPSDEALKHLRKRNGRTL